jgi:hypothetical protein
VTRFKPRVLSHAAALAAALACIAAGFLAGCAGAPPRARTVTVPVIHDVPSVLRGTVGAEAMLLKADPVIVSGYGLVVGLKGTGGGDLPPAVAATMERELGLMGIGRASGALRGTALEGMTPQQLLRSKDVAVVVVYAAVMPGAPAGTPFDVYVTSVNKAPEVSLEGGTLWTTELRVGPPGHFGGHQTRHIAAARGPIFINPFAEPGLRDGVGRQDGRVLGGGTVTKPMELELVLNSESHSRARAIVQAINNRFPPAPGEPPTARGRGSVGGETQYQIVNITVPNGFRERTEEFLNILLRVQINDALPQEYAKRYVEALKSDPFLANELTWCLAALPQRAAVPFLRDLYEWPEFVPRRAALRAGALLGDPLAVPHLVEMAGSGNPAQRAEAIELLARLPGPRVDHALQAQLDASELTVRVAAYEALAERAEKMHARRILQQAQALPATIRVGHGRGGISREAQLEFESIHGVRRHAVAGKFLLDVVPVGDGLIYVTQQGRPRIVVFGDNNALEKPALVSTWSDRLVLVADSHEDDHRLLYREPNRANEYGETLAGRMVSSRVPADLPGLVEYLAHQPTPEDPRPGFGMTYSEVVGVLHAFWSGGVVQAGFAIEDDLLQSRLLHAAQLTAPDERPESASDAEAVQVLEANIVPQLVEPQPVPQRPRTYVVPLEPPARDRR